MDASAITCDRSSMSCAFQLPRLSKLTAFSVPLRQGVHWPQLSYSKKRMRLSATALVSSLSERTTTAWLPTKQPDGSSPPESRGKSDMEAGGRAREAPPGRYPLKWWPSSMPPQWAISSLHVEPAAVSTTPGFLTRPDTE